MIAAPATGGEPDGTGAGAAFPWDEAMTAGLGLLKLSPREFWAATPRELFAALGGGRTSGQQAPARSELDALMARFPDVGRDQTG